MCYFSISSNVFVWIYLCFFPLGISYKEIIYTLAKTKTHLQKPKRCMLRIWFDKSRVKYLYLATHVFSTTFTMKSQRYHFTKVVIIFNMPNLVGDRLLSGVKKTSESILWNVYARMSLFPENLLWHCKQWVPLYHLKDVFLIFKNKKLWCKL